VGNSASATLRTSTVWDMKEIGESNFIIIVPSG
jgi:hypothetical protein